MRRLLVLPVLASAAIAMAACSTTSSSSSSSGSADSAAGSSSSTTGGTGSSSGAAGSSGTGSGGVPAVSGATNLHAAPVVAAGTPPAPTTLVTKDLVVGSGATATTSSTVVVQYVGANYATGQTFDSSWSYGQAATFPLNGVIPGFAQGIVGMKVGGRREIVIPPDLGYGPAGSPPRVGPNETLVFVVDLTALQ